jgi:hypothetical protein
MKKAILLEDKVNRQENFSRKAGIELSSLKNLHNVAGGSEFSEHISRMGQNDFGGIEQYDALIIHRSVLSELQRNLFFEYAKRRSFPLVYFSGGSTSSTLSNKDGFPFLSIDSDLLYSSNLVEFMTEMNEGRIIPEILIFGKSWLLNMILNLIRKVNSYINGNLGDRLPSRILLSKLPLLNNDSIRFYLGQKEIDMTWLDEPMIEDPTEKLKVLLAELKSNSIILSHDE